MKVWLKVPFYLVVFISKIKSSSSDIINNWPTLTNETNTIDFRTISFAVLSPESCQLKSKNYISNGLCSSAKPIAQVVCAESCSMPVGTRSPYSFHLNSLRRRRRSNKNQRRNPMKWRCLETSTRKKRVKLVCHDGTIRSYTLRLVTGCKCTPTEGKSRQIKKGGEQKIGSVSTFMQNQSVKNVNDN